MGRYSVYRLRSGELVVDCQADLLAHLQTRIVAPLVPADDVPRPMKRLNPSFLVDGASLLLATHLVGAIHVDDIVEEVTSLTARDNDIANALDFLMIGF